MKTSVMRAVLVLAFSLLGAAGAFAQKGTPDAPMPPDQGTHPGAQKAPLPTMPSTVRGDVLSVEEATDGAFYTVRDPSGKEVRLHVSKETRIDGALRVGDKIEAQTNPSGHAVSIEKSSENPR